VLLRRDGDARYRQVGQIQQRHGRELTLVLEDGSTCEHRLADGEMTPVEGSFIHLLRVAPQVVEATLTKSPERIYKQLLCDAGSPMSARQLKDKLSDFTPELQDESWKRAKPALDADPDVERQGKGQRAYKVRASVSVDLLDLIPATTYSSRAQGASCPPGSPDGSPPTVDADAERGAAPPRAEAGGRSNESEGLTEPEPSSAEEAVAAAELPDDLLARLSGRFPDLGLRSGADIARRPLAVAIALRTMSRADRQAMGTDLGDDDSRLLRMLAPPADTEAGQEDALDPHGQDWWRGLLDAAVRELRESIREKKARATFVWLLESAAATGQVDPHVVIRAAGILAQTATPAPELDRCLRLLADLVDSDARGDLSTWDLTVLARAVRAVPFDRDGGRTRLTAALHRRSPQEARKSRWWDRADAGQLAEAARGRLGNALDDDEIALGFVAPLVSKLVEETGSRSGVALVWGLPSQLARHVDGRRMARLIGEVASRDETTQAWFSALSNAEAVADLKHRLARLEEALTQARHRESEARDEADRLAVQLRRSAEQVAAARNADLSDRTSRDRQVRVDLLRTLAVVAAQVLQSEGARADAALVRQVTHACRREGLDGFDEPGQEVIYDPELHEALTVNLSAGSRAAVVRGGYTWTDGDKRVVLVKAQVVAA